MTLQKTKFIAILILAIVFSHPSWAGGEGGKEGGGGDASEARVSEIRQDLIKWIADGGAQELVLPKIVSYAAYVNQMNRVLTAHAVIVGFVTTEQEARAQHPEQKVEISGQSKTCRSFISKRDWRPHILCNTERFAATSPSEQYRLIHHEFAGLVRLETNEGASSDYRISDQITDFLVTQEVLRLAVKKKGTAPKICRWEEVPLSRPSTPSSSDKQKDPQGYSVQCTRVAGNSLCGIVDPQGQFKALPYSEIEPFSDGLAKVSNGKKWGYVDYTGAHPSGLDCRFDAAEKFKDGYAQVTMSERRSLVDTHGRQAVTLPKEWKFGPIDPGRDTVVVLPEALSPHLKLYFPDGRILMFSISTGQPRASVPDCGPKGKYGRCELGWLQSNSFQDGLLPVSTEKKGKGEESGPEGYIDTNGEWRIKPVYRRAYAFEDGVAVVSEHPGWEYFIDINGAQLFGKTFQSARYFRNGFAAVLQDGKWTYIRRDGSSLTDLSFDEISDFTADGLAVVVDYSGERLTDQFCRTEAPIDGGDGIGICWRYNKAKVGLLNSSGVLELPMIFHGIYRESTYGNGPYTPYGLAKIVDSSTVILRDARIDDHGSWWGPYDVKQLTRKCSR